MKSISSVEPDQVSNVPRNSLASDRSCLKVRRSLAVLGLALSVGTAGVLVNQQNSKELKVAPVAQSPKTLADVLAQNSEHKYELARAAIAAGKWEDQQGIVRHVVREDETLWQLTQIYQVDAAAIAASNGISATTELQPGSELVIPPVNGVVHRVKPGDTLEAIARFYSVPEGEIVKYTSLKSPEFLEIDQPLVIPGNVSTLITARENDAKRRLIAERDRLRQRLEEVEGRTVLVSSTSKTGKLDKNSIVKSPKFTVYHVQDGDTIETIARRYGISQSVIIEQNKLENPHWLELHQELKIPASKLDSTMQTVAYLGSKPAKVLVNQPNTVASKAAVDESKATQGKDVTAELIASAKLSSDNSPKTDAQADFDQLDQSQTKVGLAAGKGIRVTAATPMIPPTVAIAPRFSAWGGLMQLTGADLPGNLPNEPTQEEVPNFAKSSPVNTTLPVATEPVLRVAAALLPFSADKLIEQQAGLATVKPPASVTVPASEPSVQMPKVTVTPSSVPATNAVEQKIAANTLPAAAPLVVPASEPSVQVPTAVPSVSAVEQKIAANTLPVEAPASEFTPVAEPPVQMPKILAAALSVPAIGAVEQNVLNSANGSSNQEAALLPDPESRMSSVEVKRLESEVEQLNAKVREAEVKAAARQAEALKIAAATVTPSANPNISIDPNREAIAPEAVRGLQPELPQLVAKAYLPEASDYGLSTGFIWPAEGMLSSGFGWRWGRVHQGIDIANSTGTPILAAASGTVEYAGWNDGGYGNMVDIRHADGTVTRYAHLSALYVQEGQSVSQTQVIAAMGSTGFSTGPHLHFEIRPGGGGAVDPMAYLARR